MTRIWKPCIAFNEKNYLIVNASNLMFDFHCCKTYPNKCFLNLKTLGGLNNNNKLGNYGLLLWLMCTVLKKGLFCHILINAEKVPGFQSVAMFINTGEGKRGRGEATATSILHLECLPRIVITQIHPTTINTNSSPAAKRKLGGPVASIRLLAESRKVASEILDTFWTEGKGESSRFCLEQLPSLVLCHLMQFLPHSALLNLSMTSSCLHSLVMREWKNNPSIWRHITLSPSLSPSRLASLKKTLVGKKRFIRSIRLDMIHTAFPLL